MSQKGLLEDYDRYVLVVALHGQAYSGKDESRLLLEALAKQAGSHVIEMRYAEPLYKLVQALVPEAHPLMSKEAKERPRKELGGMSVRQLLVTAGEGSRRFVDDAWVKIHSDQLMRRVSEALDQGHRNILVIIPDLRKETERDVLHVLLKQENSPWQYDDVAWGGTVVHLVPKNAPVNPDPDPGTETPLEVLPGELVAENNHLLGRVNLAMVLYDELSVASGADKVGALAEHIFLRHPIFDSAAKEAQAARLAEEEGWA